MRLPRRFFVVNGIYLNSFIEIKKQIKFLIKAERARSIFWGSDILNFSWALQSGYSAKLFFAICGKESSSAQTKFSLPVTTGSARENLNTDYFQLKNWKKMFWRVLDSQKMSTRHCVSTIKRCLSILMRR